MQTHLTITDERNFGDMIWRDVALYPDKVAIEQGDQCVTYRELEERTQRVAGLLARLGVTIGTRVLLLFPNDFRFIECLLGTLRAGGVVVPANIRLGGDALTFIAAHSESEVMIAHVDLLEHVESIRGAAPLLRHVLVAGSTYPGTESYDDLVAATPAGFTSVPVDPTRDVALQMYTSGSTGVPKGCLLSHANKWWQARSPARGMQLDERDKSLVMGPLYHAIALWACLLPMLYTGGSVAILPGFDAERVLDAIDRYRPTFTSGTPSMFSLLLARLRANPGRWDVSSIRFLMCGSAPVPEELMRDIKERFDCEVSETYGLTEGGANVMQPRWGIKKLGSCGLPLPDVEIRIVDVEDPAVDCPVGTVGELWSRSPANALGYFKQPEATAERFTPDGWLRTGDLMRSDEQGYIYFCGRKDDMINVGGENVYPKEVETILLTHPEIAEAVVVGAPHKVKGQAPVAWVVLHQADSVREDDIKQFFLARGPAYAHPRRVFFLERLPVSGTNKIDRKSLELEARARVGVLLSS
jgi:long-chain acyl-CoA synthetase